MEAIVRLIQEKQRFLLTTHVAPDGDGLGSELALYHYLAQIGKSCVIFNTDPTPPKFEIVDPGGVIQVFDVSTPLPPIDAAIVVDTNDWQMLGALQAPIQKSRKPVFFLDHHVPDHDFSEAHYIDPKSGSTGEIVYALLKKMQASISPNMATALYVAMVTDAHTFQFRGASANYHRNLATLLGLGVDSARVYQHIFARNSFEKMRLLGYLLSEIHTTSSHQIAWLQLPKELRTQYGVTVEETESFVDYLTSIKGLKIAMVFREEDDGRIKVSFRGLEGVPVIGLALRFGGGGHRFAAATRLTDTLDRVVQRVSKAARELLLEAKT